MTIEGQLALEAVKPATGFISAILGPKIEKVRDWATEKELKGKLNSDSLAETMEQYLVKLASRVGEITSITFPQLKLDIFKAYEPLFMSIHGSREEHHKVIESDDLIPPVKNSIIIIDSAGMGKSTFSKFIVAKLLFKSEKIPILFELRRTDPSISIIDNFATELDFPGKKFDRVLFYKLLEIGKFYVILDGFDECKVDHQELLASQIHELSIKGGQNTLLITSRPQETLPELINSIPLKFLPFTKTQALSLLNRYDKISELDVGKRLSSEISSVPQRFIESPLLVSLLYRTFGVNNSIADRTSTFYDEIYHALYKGHDLINKNGYAREKKSKLDFEDFRKLLRALCHYMMLKRKTSFQNWSDATNAITQSIEIASVKPTSASNFLDDLFVAVPLMQRDGNEYRFFHKTILEYFAAEYIIFNQSSASLLRKIFESNLSPSFQKVFEFIADIDRRLFDSIITLDAAMRAKDLNLENNKQSLVISSVQLLSKFKIGLWPTDKYAEHDDEDAVDFFPRAMLSRKVHSENTYNRTTWKYGKARNKDYLLAVTYNRKFEELHPIAWDAISEKIPETPNGFDDETIYNFNKVKKIIGTECWVTPCEEMISKLRLEDKAIYALMICCLNDSGEARSLSPQKVDEIIMKIEERKSLTLEMRDFI